MFPVVRLRIHWETYTMSLLADILFISVIILGLIQFSVTQCFRAMATHSKRTIGLSTVCLISIMILVVLITNGITDENIRDRIIIRLNNLYQQGY